VPALGQRFFCPAGVRQVQNKPAPFSIVEYRRQNLAIGTVWLCSTSRLDLLAEVVAELVKLFGRKIRRIELEELDGAFVFGRQAVIQ